MKQIHHPSLEELQQDIEAAKIVRYETLRCDFCNKRKNRLTTETDILMCDCNIEPKQWSIKLDGITVGDIMRKLKLENKGVLSEEFLYQLEILIMGTWYQKTQLK